VLFIKKTTTNSECQFKSDFGEYPPKPLLAMKVNRQFDVVYFGWFGKQIYYTKQIFFLIRALCSKDRNFITNLPMSIEMRKSVSEAKGSILETIAVYKSSPFIERIVFWVFLIIILPLLPLLFLYFGSKFLILIFNNLRRHNEVLGSFTRLPDAPPHVAVYDPFFSRFKISHLIHAITSHEHVHFLQSYYFPERILHKFDNEKRDFLKNLLEHPEQDIDFCSYHFFANEIEARLHEVVLSYYRKYKELPSDKAGFLKLLFGSREMSRIRASMVREVENRPYPNRRVFDVRCEFFEGQILSAISKLTDPFKFLLEVLPVVYGNLLIVYGDTNRAEKYFDTVKDFEFYNELYGEVIIPAKR
jgi:hypothetical protein